MRLFGKLLSFAAASALLGITIRCAPEELTYGSSVGADGSAGSGGGSGDAATFDAAGWVEVCGNGVDDDDNGLTDCEDPVCSEYACVPTAPAGWTGPLAVFEGSPSSLPSCPEGLDAVGDYFRDLRFERASCSGCSCGSPNSESCMGVVDLSTTGSCSAATVSVPLTGSGCVTPGLPGPVNAANVSFNASGSCGSATQATVQKKAPTWASAVRACESPDLGSGAGCEAGEVCSPASALADPCIVQAGEHACPAGFPRRRLVYTANQDTRSCSDCSCSYSGSCNATVTGYGDVGCGIPTFANTGGCAAPADVQGLKMSGASSSGTCSASGGSPRGCVLPDAPTTMCCAGTTAACPSGKGPEMVEVPKPGGGTYCVDSTEVTNSQYEAFLATSPALPTNPECAFKTSLAPGAPWPDTDVDEPINFVDWCDAYAFCAWAGKRLCGASSGGAATYSSADSTDAQWYNACSAGGQLDYGYGTESISGACPTSIADVKEFPCCQAGYSGVYDMVGYMREWIDACSATAGASDDCRVMGNNTCSTVQASKRNARSTNVGFRCCSG